MSRNRIIWSKEDERYILDHYLTDSFADIALHFGVSAPTISVKLRSMGLSVGRGARSGRRIWSESELAYLREHYPHEAAVDIADVLGINTQSIRKKAIEMGLKKAADYDRRKYYQRYVKGYKNAERRGVA